MFGLSTTTNKPGTSSTWLMNDKSGRQLLSLNPTEGCTMRSSTSNNLQHLISRDRKFLPGRPSLHDILSVAPQWKEAFETVYKSIALRDSQISQIHDLTQDLKEKNETQKELIKERVKTACADIIAQEFLLSEIETQQPIVRKWRRQVNALSTTFQRTFGSNKVTGQPLIVPQPDYLRFIDAMRKRFQKTEKRALSVEQITAVMRQELQGETPPLDLVLKKILAGFMNQYKLLKYTYVGLHEELKSAIERYKYTHPRSIDLDQQLEDNFKGDGNIYLAMLTSTSKPFTAPLKMQAANILQSTELPPTSKF